MVKNIFILTLLFTLSCSCNISKKAVKTDEYLCQYEISELPEPFKEEIEAQIRDFDKKLSNTHFYKDKKGYKLLIYEENKQIVYVMDCIFEIGLIDESEITNFALYNETPIFIFDRKDSEHVKYCSFMHFCKDYFPDEYQNYIEYNMFQIEIYDKVPNMILIFNSEGVLLSSEFKYSL